MKREKTYTEINDKIKSGKAVILTAEEVSRMAETASPEEIVEKVDVVTTATFGAMCSSGIFINFGHSSPPIKMTNVTLNDVNAYAGIAAVDAYLGAAELSNTKEKYGGAHVIQEIIDGKDISLKASAYGTDCYPLKKIETTFNKDEVNEIIMFNPRNAYQNYNVAVNTTKETKYTYMGTLLPELGNATYSSAGELSPLLNDPDMRTIGIGSRIFLGGTQGFVSWQGTQFNTSKQKNEFGIPLSNAATLCVIGNAKEMSSEYIRATYFKKYGSTIFVGIGIPIPILNEDIARFVSIRNEQIETSVVDYGKHPNSFICTTNYARLRSGKITVNGKKIRTVALSNIKKARKIADVLREWIAKGEFSIQPPVQHFPKNTSLNSLKIR